MAISNDDVLHVARLARLGLRDGEVERLQAELSAILEAVGKVSELDLADVPPTSHPLDLVNVWDDDEPSPCAHRRGSARERTRARGGRLPRPAERMNRHRVGTKPRESAGYPGSPRGWAGVWDGERESL